MLSREELIALVEDGRFRRITIYMTDENPLV